RHEVVGAARGGLVGRARRVLRGLGLGLGLALDLVLGLVLGVVGLGARRRVRPALRPAVASGLGGGAAATVAAGGGAVLGLDLLLGRARHLGGVGHAAAHERAVGAADGQHP